MPTVNINLTPEQAKLVNKTTKERGFANRSEFFRALLRYVFFNKPQAIKDLEKTEFEKPAATAPPLQEIKRKIIPILKKNDVEFAGIFGSYARGEARENSDIDILIRYKRPKSLLDFVGLKQELAETFGREVDLLHENTVKPLVRPQIKKDLKILYGQRRYI